ncbi:HEAT repeat domain-containing protein [Rubripirellula amarantea]|nr:HEAT repeat domain-containing protein [Rubripirellula amarantea]
MRIFVLLLVVFTSVARGDEGVPSSAASHNSSMVAGKTLSDLKEGINSEDRVVRTRSVKSIAAFAFRSDDKAIGQALSDAMDHDDAAVRYIAMVSLGDITKAPYVPQVISDATQAKLKTAVKNDPSNSVKMAASYALCQAGEVDEYLSVLLEDLDHPLRGVSCSAAELIGKIGPAAQAAKVKLSEVAANNDAKKKIGDYHRGGAAATALLKISAP